MTKSPFSFQFSGTRHSLIPVFSSWLWPAGDRRFDNDDQSDGDEHDTGDAAEARGRAELLDCHDDAEDCHPDDVHEPDREHQQHHRPAAAEAIQPLAQTDAEYAARIGSPMTEEETERMLALRDAGMLQRRELIEPGSEEHRARDEWIGHARV